MTSVYILRHAINGDTFDKAYIPASIRGEETPHWRTRVSALTAKKRLGLGAVWQPVRVDISAISGPGLRPHHSSKGV